MVERMQRHWRQFREFRESTTPERRYGRRYGRRYEQRYNRRRQDERSRITTIYVGYPLLFGGASF